MCACFAPVDGLCVAAIHVQATHIFDGLEQWPTHIMFLTRGCLKTFKSAEEIPELADDRLLELVERCAASV